MDRGSYPQPPAPCPQSSAVQDYVKAIHQICVEAPSGVASTGALARHLDVTPGTVTAMLQRLAESELVDYTARQGVTLSDQGRQLALGVVRRHRLIELFLAETLGVPWDEVHQEAENLEHAASDRLIDRIDQHLGYPDRDPHGHPIPDAEGRMRTCDDEPLAACQGRTRFVLVRVPDDSPEFLRYLSNGGLTVGTTATVLQNQASAGVVTVEVGDRRLSLGREVAVKLGVRRLPDDPS